MNKTILNFGLIGISGYVAPRHLQAIKSVGGNLLSALDPNDSVGILDSFFPETSFFTEFERFDRYVDNLYRNNNKIDYFAICSPNHLHDSHIRFALKSNSNVICEKPLVISPWNIDAIQRIEKDYRKKVYSIHQLRLHPSIQKLKKKMPVSNKLYDIEITYIAARGKWYFQSWKGDESKSGGILYNIGIHFFDIIEYLFGPTISCKVHYASRDAYSGTILTKKSRVRYFLSINQGHINFIKGKRNQRVFKSMIINKKEINLSEDFEKLHTLSYRKILLNQGFEIQSIRSVIELLYRIKHLKISPLKDDYHPLVKKVTK